MPVFGIPDNEIEDVFAFRQDDDGGMPHLCLDIDELIDTGNRLDAQHRSLGPSRRYRSERPWQEDQNHNARPQDPQEFLKAMH